MQIILQNYTERDVFELSNSFYLSMGLDDMQMCYDTPCANENTPENKVSGRSFEIHGVQYFHHNVILFLILLE